MRYNTENTISTNGRYNQAETALIVDLKTHKSVTIIQQWIIN